jgi:MoxR-like ATPase
MSTVIVGKAESMELLLVALLAEGHMLIEDVPGLGKTLMAKALAVSIGGTFKRVQFTPGLLPTDITGFNTFNRKHRLGHAAAGAAALGHKLPAVLPGER